MPNDNTDDNLQDITKAFLKDSQNELISLLIERFKKDYLPRSLKKSYHYGTMGRIDDLESVIGFHQALYELCSLSNKPLRLKQYQAHTAVQKVKTFNVTGARHEYAEIENRILDNKLYFRNNIAVRDLVIEISRTCHYFKEQYAPYTNLIEQCETGLYTCLEQALKPQYTFAATITLSNMRAIIANCSSENVMPKLIGEEFKKTFDYTLSTHPLFHSSMIEFLVAEDNHVVSEDETNAHSTALDLAPLSAFYFTNYLFFASISAREMYFNHYSTTIKTLDFSLDDIKNALILLNQAQAKQLIQFPNIQSRLKQMSSNEIFEFIVSVPVDLREYIEFTCKSHEPQNYILERASCVIS